MFVEKKIWKMVKKIGCFVIFEIPVYSCAEDFYTFWIFIVDIKN